MSLFFVLGKVLLKHARFLQLPCLPRKTKDLTYTVITNGNRTIPHHYIHYEAHRYHIHSNHPGSRRYGLGHQRLPVQIPPNRRRD